MQRDKIKPRHAYSGVPKFLGTTTWFRTTWTETRSQRKNPRRKRAARARRAVIATRATRLCRATFRARARVKNRPRAASRTWRRPPTRPRPTCRRTRDSSPSTPAIRTFSSYLWISRWASIRATAIRRPRICCRISTWCAASPIVISASNSPPPPISRRISCPVPWAHPPSYWSRKRAGTLNTFNNGSGLFAYNCWIMRGRLN